MNRAVARIAFTLGAIGLLGAGLSDFCGVVGRHIGYPLPGAIELVRMFIVLVVSASLVAATWANGHAVVHVVIERLPPASRAAMLRLGAAAGAIAFGLLSAAGIWMLLITWNGSERTDLLGLPMAPWRILWCVATSVVAARLAWNALAGKEAP